MTTTDNAKESNNTSTSRSERDWWERDRGLTSSNEDLVPPGPARLLPLEIWESKEFDVVDNRRTSSLPGDERRIAMYNGLGNQGTEFQTQTIVTARKSESSDGTIRK